MKKTLALLTLASSLSIADIIGGEINLGYYNHAPSGTAQYQGDTIDAEKDLKWSDKNDLFVKAYFEHHFPIKLYIDNDLKCAALAEAKAHKSTHLCALYVGTGIGLGVIEDRKLIRGHDNFATEIGHVPFLEAPFVCGCGRNNCIELFASGSGLRKWTHYYNLNPDQTLRTLEASQEPHAQKILDQFKRALLHAPGCVVTLFNPEILVLGGGIIEANASLVDFIKSNIHDTALKRSLENVMIVKSNLKQAPLRGALLLKESYA